MWSFDFPDWLSMCSVSNELRPEASVVARGVVMKHVPCHVKKHVLYQPGSARDMAVVTLEIRMCMLDGASGSCNGALGSVSQ